MEKKYYVSDLKKLNTYEFSERLKFFISESGYTHEQFYNKYYDKLGISYRAFISYLTSKDSISARKPKKETINVMAEILNIPVEFLIWDTEEFKEFFYNYLAEFHRKCKVPLLTIDIDTEHDISCAIEPACNWNTKEEAYEIFKSRIEDEYPNKEENREIYAFWGVLSKLLIDGRQKFVIDERIYTILNCFDNLNQKGREKLLKYGNVIIDDILKKSTEIPLIPRDREELVNEKNFNWGRIKMGFLNWFPGLMLLGEEMIELDLEIYQWDIFLTCFYIDANNNGIFPEDALESFTLIAQLFSLDEEFML